MTWSDHEAREHVARAEALLSGLDALTDPAVRTQVTDALHALVTLYGECLARMVQHADGPVADALAADELVGHLLLVHDVHPDPVETRVRRAVREAGGRSGAELLGVEGAVARVRLPATGCGSSAEGVRKAVEDAVAWVAPEIERVETETEAKAARAQALIPVESLFRPGSGAAVGSR